VEPQPEPPEVASDPLLLIPSDASELLLADIEALRESRHFPMLRNWAVRFGCLSPSQPHWLLDQTQQLIAANLPDSAAGGGRSRGVVILRGEFSEQVASQALAEVIAVVAPSQAGATEQRAQRGRFELIARGPLTGVQLSESLVALGDGAAIDAVLALADGVRDDRFTASAFYETHAQGGTLQDHTASLLATPSPTYREQLSRQLASVGARDLLDGVREGSLLAVVDLADELAVAIDAGYQTEEQASQAADSARQLYFQANLLLRLTGMPRIFDHATATATGSDVRYELRLSEDELARLRERLEWLFEAGSEDRCVADR
jgi:hypothetical protein